MENTKFLAVPFLALFAITAQAQADNTEAQIRSLDSRVSALEQKKGANAMVNPSGRPQVRDGADMFFTADWLIWQSHVNGLTYASKAESGHDDATALYNSTAKDMHFDWDFGFRLGLGWNTPHDGWDLNATWTWFENTASRTGQADASHLFLAANQFAPAVDSDTEGYASAKANWRLHLNLIDLELGREFFVSKWMTLRPFMGLRNGWIRQKTSINFNQANLFEAQPGSDLAATNNYWGIGPRAGLNTQWGLGYGFSLFADSNFSLLYGFFHLDDGQFRHLDTDTSNTALTNQGGFRVGRAIAELSLGLRWDTMFADDHCHFWIQGGWENLMFFGLEQSRHFIGTQTNNLGALITNQGDLTIQGWTLSARLDF